MADALLVNAAILVGVVLALWLVSLWIGDVSFIDAFWGIGMAMLALTSWRHVPGGAAGPLSTLLMAMTVIWGGRLGIYLFLRWRKEGEDKRYERILRKDREKGRFAIAALYKIWLGQAVLLFITCLPAQLGILSGGEAIAAQPLVWAGVALWAVGMVFEGVGDWQLARFLADPASKGKVMDSGLWRYTRHPNYFGDACVWWGIWLAAASTGLEIAAISVIGPIFLTFTLTKWSGAPLLEGGMAKRRPEYADYVARTSGFIPMPPKK